MIERSARCAFLAGAGVALGARALLPRLLKLKLDRDLQALNAGDHEPLLAGYADDAVLIFNDGDHRWSGTHHGKEAIGRFLRNFTGAGLQGELRELFVAGPPWRLTLIARFDDHANGSDGAELYRNRTVLLVRSRWGRIVHHEDFYEDTERIAVLDRRLRELGVEPAA